ncbi:MAG: uroporphyrinogen-III synthase [Bacteroidetes bacterium]|nr:MAG: uroporphyrinogen-III synthase [Bacteroidota bacterium]
MKIKNVLISQPQPENDKSPYSDLARQFNLNITFRKLIKIERIDNKEFRKLRINILDFTAIIFTSKHAADHFFSLCEELRVTIPETMKYFCVSEAIALYLQKYVQYRKRKIFFGKNKFPELLDLIKKQKNEKYFFPCAFNHNSDIPELLISNKINHFTVPIYETVSDDVDDIDISSYQMIVLFSPFGIESIRKNFPDYKQEDTVIAAFGASTVKAIEEAGFTVQIKAPTSEAPSMTMAIELYLQNKGKK